VASYVVDGLVVPVSVAGHAALDFCNTRAGWGQPTPKEYLHTHAHLTVWARENGLLTAGAARGVARAGRTDPSAATAVLARALALREALYAVVLRRGAAPDWAAVNAEVRSAGAVATLTPALPSGWTLPADGVEGALRAVTWAAAGFLTSPLSAHVGACPGAGCGWAFTDPRDRRRWCSMAWCGNRNKARRHADQRRARPHA
jgi:predicted RNA-binding Zn ribbon-like protein